MPVRYADESVKLSSQTHVKLRVLQAIRIALSTTAPDTFYTFSWVQLLRPIAFPVQQEAKKTRNAVAEQVLQRPADHCANVTSDVSASSSSSGSVTSSSTDESEHDDADLATLEWVVPKHPSGKIHRAHPDKVSRDGFPRPVCCSISGVPHTGAGVFAAMAEFPQRQWCERCAADICVCVTSA